MSRQLVTSTMAAALLWLAAVTAGAAEPAVVEDAMTPAMVVERVVWNRTPIAITLPVGVERQVKFPAPVRVGVPGAIATESVLRTQSIDATVYWLAKEAFDPQRVQVREIDGGRTYLIDLEAVEGAAVASPVEVHAPAPRATGQPAAAAAAPPARETPRYGYVELTRFAAQMLYAPQRLLPELPGVAQEPLGVRNAVALVRGGAVEAIPEVAWSDGNLYVTAVRLTNRSSRRILLDPRMLRGRWLARTFQHAVLMPAGDPQAADVTMVYLISPQPFEESL